MYRLTARNTDGRAYFPECFKENGCKGEGCKKEYCDFNIKTCEKLAEYEDLEESGRLVELPCAVGDTVYVLMQHGGIAEAEVRDYVHFLTCGFCLVLTSDKFDKQNIPFSEVGKTVFLTHEAAEAKLESKE